MSQPKVVYFSDISVRKRIAIVDAQVCEVTNLFDEDGDETDDPEAAYAAVVKIRDDMWASVDLTMFPEPTFH